MEIIENKPAKRTRGPNKATKFTKLIINNMLSDYHASGLMAEDLRLLEPKDRLHVMLKLMEFITPKPQSVDMTISDSRVITIEETLATLAQENE